MNFDQAFDRVIGSEGGFQRDSRDRGNWTGGKVGVGELKGTKFGISAAAFPQVDIANLTVATAKPLAKQYYWDRIDGDQLPPAVAFQVFDAAYNSGIENGVRFLQRAVGVADDGHVGPVTLGAVKAMSATDVLMRVNAERLDFLRKLSTWPTYGAGWAGRIAANLRYGAIDA